MTQLLAPNGKPSNLTPEQYKLVRTPEFIAWFGNFEKANILNLLNKPITIVNNHKERNFDYEKSYIKLHSLFKIDKDGNNIQLSRSGLKHICRHARPDVLFSSIDYLPEILENAIKIEEEANRKLDLKPNIKKFWVYISNFIFEGVEYIYRITVQEENDGDLIIHDTGVVEKESILKTVHAKPSYRANQNALCKDRKILDITNNIIENLSNVSKVVDENGEPLICYHGTNSIFTIFDKEFQNTKTGFGDFGAGFYFTSSFGTAKYYTLKSENNRIVMPVFLKIMNPFIIELNWEKLSEQSIINYKGLEGLSDLDKDFLNNTFKDDYRPSKAITKYFSDYGFQELLIRNDFDGVVINRINIYEKPDINHENQIQYFNEIVVFEPNQIKLTDGTNTTFDASNPDIRFDEGGGVPALLAPNGKPSNLNPEQYKLVRGDFFKKFFGDWEKLALTKINDSGIDEVSLKRLEEGVSKAVDENGEPLVVLHATTHDFNVFSNDEDTKRRGVSKEGIFFTDSISVAETYIYKNLTPTPKQIKSGVFFKENANIMPVFLSLQDPLIVDAGFTNFNSIGEKHKHINDFISIAKKHNKDGLIVKNVKDLGSAVDFLKDELFATTYVVFKPNQIKSAVGNNGNFDTNNPDIRYEGGGFVSFKDKYNKKFGYPTSTSHNLEQISKDTRVSLKGLQQIYNKGIGAFKTNPSSVRPTVKSKEQWAMARVYSAVMGGKASKIDSNELKMKNGGGIPDNYIHVVNNFGSGETLNKVFNDWSNIQSEKDQANWSMRVKLLRFGTYGQYDLLYVMEKFDFDKSDKINGILKRDFKKEVESAYDNEIITINKNNEMKKESETFGGGGGVNDNFPIVKLKIYANNPSYNKRYFESEALFDFSNEKIKFINIDTFGDDYRFNWIKVKENSKGFYIDFEYYGGRIYIENYINLFDQEKNKKKLAGGGGVAAKSSHTLNSNKGKIAISLDKRWSDINILLVPISFLVKCSEFNRRNDPKYSLDDSAKNIENIKKSFIENGITEPLILNYIRNESKLLLTEGNHRLNALIELEVPYYPVCVTVIDSWNRGKGKGVKTKVKPYMISEINKSKYLSVDNFEGVPYVNIENNHVDVNETDTLTINVPLLIRLFEYIREDVDNDAQIHFLTENLLKLKDKELSMSDYDSIIDGIKIKKTAEKILALGGLAEGPPHSEGGIPLVVKSTGQNIEIEGGELVVNKFSSSETEKFEFEGKDLTPCEIVSELNSMDNNGVEIDCNKILGRFKK